MRLDRAFAEEEPRGKLSVALAGGEQPQHLERHASLLERGIAAQRYALALAAAGNRLVERREIT